MTRVESIYTIIKTPKGEEKKFSHIEVEVGGQVYVNPIKFMRVSECKTLQMLLDKAAAA